MSDAESHESWRAVKLKSEQAAPHFSWQSQKSAITRLHVLDAAIDCLAELGYAQTSTILIAKRACISRGAITYYFPTKVKMIEAVFELIHARRLQSFRADVARIPEGGPVLRDLLVAYWKQATSPCFVVFLELQHMARTDLELRELDLPAGDPLAEEWLAATRRLLPEWRKDPEGVERPMTHYRLMIDGLAINPPQGCATKVAEEIIAYFANRLTGPAQRGPLAYGSIMGIPSAMRI